MYRHTPVTSLSASSAVPAINQRLTVQGTATDQSVFRRTDPQSKVVLSIFGVTVSGEDESQNALTDFVVDVERSLDDGTSWTVYQSLTGPQSIDIPYPNGMIRMRFKLRTKGAGSGVRIQAIT